MKKLTRPGAAHSDLSIIEDILGVKPQQRESLLPLTEIQVLDGFNPRTAYLSAAERENTFSREALSDLILSMSEVQENGQPRGMLQPLLVRPLAGGGYALVAGERRFHAAQFAGLSQIPVVVRQFTEREALAAAIIENAQRLKVDQVSEALAGFELMSALTGQNREELVRHLNAIRQGDAPDTFNLDQTLRAVFGTGVSTWSQQRAKVLQLSPQEREAIQSGKLSAKVVFPLLKLGEQAQARQAVLTELLALPAASSRDTERLLQPYLSSAPAPSAPAERARALLPKLKKLPSHKRKAAEKLLSQLEELLAEQEA